MNLGGIKCDPIIHALEIQHFSTLKYKFFYREWAQKDLSIRPATHWDWPCKHGHVHVKSLGLSEDIYKIISMTPLK